METKPTVFNALANQMTMSPTLDYNGNLDRKDSKALAKNLSALALTHGLAVEEMATISDLTKLVMDESTATATYGFMKMAGGVQMMKLLTMAGFQMGSFTEDDVAELQAMIHKFIRNTSEFMDTGDAMIKQALISAGRDIARGHE